MSRSGTTLGSCLEVFVSSRRLHVVLRSVVFISAALLSACGGGHGSATAPAPVVPAPAPVATTAGVTVPLSSSAQNVPLALGSNIDATLVLHASAAASGAAVTVSSDAAAGRGLQRALASRTCPAIPAITLLNPFPFAITLVVDSLQLTLPCTVDGTLFGVTFLQVKPVPATIVPLKVGDVTASGRQISFAPQVTKLVLPPRTLSQLVIAAEESPAEVTLPIVPGGATTQLTSNVSNVPSDLSFTYQSASGGTSFGSACFPAFDANHTLAPALQGQPIVGKPSFYCTLDPGSATITFGSAVSFSISKPIPDASIISLDGPTSTFLCTGSSEQQCPYTSFTIPQFQNVIASNVQDLQACAPLSSGTDCSGTLRTSVSSGATFDAVVVDDPSYTASTPLHPVPWDGLLRAKTEGACSLTQPTGSDGIAYLPGPSVRFGVKANGTGSCRVLAWEDTAFIAYYAIPTAPKARTTAVDVVVGP